jgi:Ca-activated chloride channel family protein
MRSALIPLLVIVTASITIAQEPTFRTGTQIVSVVTTVTDSQGRLVPGLEQEAFTILDNGEPQPITFFQNDVQPFTVVVMMDYSASMTANLDRLQAAAEQFILRMLPEDRGQVGSFSDKIQFSGTFTNDRDDLIFALRDLQFGNPTRLWDAIDASIGMLEGIEGRRVVLGFTDGDDTASRAGRGDVLDHARDQETMIYAIGLESEYFNETRPRSAQPRARDRWRVL